MQSQPAQQQIAPCPKCGSAMTENVDVRYAFSGDPDDLICFLECTGEGCRLETTRYRARQHDLAVGQWNTKVADGAFT